MSDLASQVATLQAEYVDSPPGLVRHIRRVLTEALDLAGYWDIDPARAELATWGHDLFRAHPPSAQLQLAREAGIAIDPADERDPVLLHGPLAAAVLRDRFRIVDDEALAAVAQHTLGAPDMPLLAKVILIADKVERRKRRRAPVMRDIRRLARRDLDLALICWADWKWVEERERGWGHHPAHWDARRAWLHHHHAEIALPGRVSDAEFEATES